VQIDVGISKAYFSCSDWIRGFAYTLYFIRLKVGFAACYTNKTVPGV